MTIVMAKRQFKTSHLTMFRISTSLLLLTCIGTVTCAQAHHEHLQGPTATAPVEPPKIYLDKSLRIVQYQLGRLDNERLLLVERRTDDPKYAPVYTAILTRAGMSPQYREEALAALVELNGSDTATELLKTLTAVPSEDRQQRRTAQELVGLLLRQPADVLNAHGDDLRAATRSDSGLLRAVAYAGLIVAGQTEASWSMLNGDPQALLDWLAAVPLVSDGRTRSTLRGRIVESLDATQPTEVRRAAVRALAHVPTGERETFLLVAPLVAEPQLRAAAVSTLLTIPDEFRSTETSARLADFLVKHAEDTPAEERTTEAFIDAMQLADQLFARLPVDVARSHRDRLRAVTVRVVRIRTVEEEMRYDTPYFAVEAGRPVQVVLHNEDLMAHNFVLTVPGALKEVAELGLQTGTTGGLDGKQFVPHSEKVMHATHLVEPGKQARLTFTAPAEPGEYPYVCTFPRHWMRMYGVMVVVEDLDAWLQNPTEPQDPIGSNRAFVQSWKMEDLQDELDNGLRGRSPEIGRRIFAEATCVQCHTVKGEGGAVGPELTDVFARWKGDRLGVLREILEPSYRIDPKYAVHLVITLEGQTVSGIVKAEDRTTVSLLANPEAQEPTVIPRTEIEEMVRTSTSMMPKALLDRFTKDEIFELLAFLEAAGGITN